VGTNDAWEVEARIEAGDAHADLVYRAMAYTVAKEIGAMAAALGDRPDAIALTGGLAHSSRFVAMVADRVSFIAPVLVFPGGDEMEALAAGALRALTGEVQALPYGEASGARRNP
jgi:butyrate kinase